MEELGERILVAPLLPHIAEFLRLLDDADFDHRRAVLGDQA